MSAETVVVFGARGLIGRALAAAFATGGARTIAADVAPVTGRKDVSEVVVDARDRAAVSRLVDDVERDGVVGVLVNCLASKPEGFFADVRDGSAADLLSVLETHVVGTFVTCQEVGGRMADRGAGTIVNFASVYGVVAPDQRIYGSSGINAPASYSAAKGAIIALTKYLAAYWGESGVRVNCVSPGGVFADQDRRFVEQYSARTPLGRMARVEEIVAAVRFLASDGASYVTGHNLMVDGGLSAW